MRHFNKESLDYKFIEKFQAGIALTGSDVKSLRTQNAQFASAKVDVQNGQPILQGLTIPLYKFSHGQDIDTTQSRNLLLSQKEIDKLLSYRNQKYMLIPVAIYFKGHWAKVEIGVGRKFRQYEKRALLKKKEFEQNQNQL